MIDEKLLKKMKQDRTPFGLSAVADVYEERGESAIADSYRIVAGMTGWVLEAAKWGEGMITGRCAGKWDRLSHTLYGPDSCEVMVRLYIRGHSRFYWKKRCFVIVSASQSYARETERMIEIIRLRDLFPGYDKCDLVEAPAWPAQLDEAGEMPLYHPHSVFLRMGYARLLKNPKLAFDLVVPVLKASQFI